MTQTVELPEETTKDMNLIMRSFDPNGSGLGQK